MLTIATFCTCEQSLSEQQSIEKARNASQRLLSPAIIAHLCAAIATTCTTNLRKQKRRVVRAHDAQAWMDGQVVRRQHGSAEDNVLASEGHRQVALRHPLGEVGRPAGHPAGGLGSKERKWNRCLDVSEELLGVNCQKVTGKEKKESMRAQRIRTRCRASSAIRLCACRTHSD